MTKYTEHFHGSDLEAIEKLYRIKKDSITSFSDNVNPLGLSPKLKSGLASRIDAIMSYPDREYSSLRKHIADYVNIDMDKITVGNGATELISLFIQIKGPKKALIIGPTYSEYEREVNLGGGDAIYYPLDEDNDFALNISSLDHELSKDVDFLILCNPNNPTSTSIKNDDMKEILDICQKKDIFVMVDETYVEFVDDLMSITSVPLTKNYNNLIILRGTSKFFAAPGLRLGYAICSNKELIKEINQRKNPWTINSLAAVAGEYMFTDGQYINDTRKLIKEERNRICSILDNCSGLKYYKPSANFILIKILKEDISSFNLFDAAIKKGYMIRNCSTFPFLADRFIRFCFLTQDKNDQLLQVILNELS